ncbi:M20/M25/M40 family metallo-hydrolase [Sphaerisporangium sp. NBC_01403]|uniref:M20 family metallopeptidase n=1 Tax=Sphaerisporangium sp. NBC_01403 TaxID=2903599 RepID=UPI0032462621
MSAGRPDAASVLAAAERDLGSVVEFARDLVRIPSRGGIDAYDPILDRVAAWLAERGIAVRRLAEPGGTTVALTCEVTGGRPGPRYVLDACLDTAPFGDEAAWSYSPLSGELADGWLRGRGASDSKAGVAIFAHVLARLHAQRDRLRGGVVLLLDVDEHTGAFGGAKAYFQGPQAPDRVDGVMIGYPGSEHVVTGGRGVLRARVHVYGVAGHSGASKTTANAIAKAAVLIGALGEVPLPSTGGEDFPLPAKLTVTAIHGGEGFSVVPDLCTLNVDIRLTPALDEQAAEKLLRGCVTGVDALWPGTEPTHVEITTRWPAYRLGPGSALKTALLEAAHAVGLNTTAKIAGPSNIGNYLAGLGIEATAGFGVDYAGLHGTDERIRIASIPAVHAAYHHALLTLLGAH